MSYQVVLDEVRKLKDQVVKMFPDAEARVGRLEDEAQRAISAVLAKNPETRKQIDIDLTKGSPDLLYPVWWAGSPDSSGVGKIEFCRDYYWQGGVGERPIHPDKVHQAGLMLQLEHNDTPWGGGSKLFEVKRFNETYAPTVSHLSFYMLGYAKRIRPAEKSGYGATVSGLDENNALKKVSWRVSGLYLRGGLKYRAFANWDVRLNVFDFTKEEVEIFKYDPGNIVGTVKPISLSDMDQPPKTLNAFVDPV